MNKKIAASVILIAIIVASVASWFVNNQISELQIQNGDLQNQVNELQDQNKELQEQLTAQEVMITTFFITGHSNPGGIMWNTDFIVRIQNNGTRDVHGLYLTFNVISNYTVERGLYMFQPYVGGIKMGEHYEIGTLKQGETQEIQGQILNNMVDSMKLSGSSFVVTLKLNNSVVDTFTIPCNALLLGTTTYQ
jgi:DNA-binding protein YbaB